MDATMIPESTASPTTVPFGKYHIVERISAGGMAEVHKAYQPDLDRYVAVKVIAPERGHDPAFRQQFEHEVRTLARLEHPNILPVYDSGWHGDTPYLVTPYVEGGTLADHLGRAMPPDEAVRILSQVGDALAYAHARGIVHRDVKPSNILITRSGHALLADFGIAQQRTEASHAGDGSGTLAYMPPEQRAGKPVDGRADIFALGVLLYELLTGKRFGRQNLVTRSTTINRLPAPWIMVITSSANYDVNARYPVAEDFVCAMQDALLKTGSQQAEAPGVPQLALEVMAMVLFALTGLGLGIYASTLARAGYRAVAIELGVGCLVASVMFACRNRAKPMTMTFLGAVVWVLLGFAALVIPTDMLTWGISIETIGYWLPFTLPGLLFLTIGAWSYVRDRRRSRAIATRPALSAARRAHFTPFNLRQTRNAIINTIVLLVGLEGVVFVIDHTTPPGSALHSLVGLARGSLILTAALLGIGLVVWYTYSQVTASASAASDAAPSWVGVGAKTRRATLDKARDYRIRIREAVMQAREGPLRDRLQRATHSLDEWVACVERLIARLDEFDRDPIIQRDRSTVPRAVHNLEARLTLGQDSDERVQAAVRQTLEARQQQLRYLRDLERLMNRTELYVEETVAALGSVYSETLLIDAKDVEGTRARRVQAGIDEQVKALRDLLNAVREVQVSRPNPSERLTSAETAI